MPHRGSEQDDRKQLDDNKRKKCIFKQLTKTKKKKQKKKQEIWTFNCLSFHFYCKRAKFNFGFCGWVGLEGSGVLTLFQFCPCWTRPPLACFLLLLFNIPPNILFHLCWSSSPLLLGIFFFNSPVVVAHLILSHINTYYCINQHHNSLVFLHVNYITREKKSRAKRMGGC